MSSTARAILRRSPDWAALPALRFPFLLASLSLSLSLFLSLFLACADDTPVVAPATELKFAPIADSLGGAGYDYLEIVIRKPGASDSSFLYQGGLSAGARRSFPLPDSLGENYRITLRASKSSDPGVVFAKTYTVVNGAIFTTQVKVTPEPGDPDSVAATDVTLDPGFLLLAAGVDSVLLAAKVLPPEAEQAVRWTSSNPAAASVDSTGLVRSGAVGKAMITAAAAAAPGINRSIEVTVGALQPLDSLVLEAHALRYFLGMPAVPLVVKMYPASALPLVAWRSSNRAVATVSLDGKVNGVAAGQVLVRAQYKGDAAKTDTCKVTVVKDPPILDVGASVSVTAGATVDFPLKVTQEYGGIVEFRYSLEAGDTLTSNAVPAGLSHKYVVAGDFTAFFSARDLEGNVTIAHRQVHVGAAP